MIRRKERQLSFCRQIGEPTEVGGDVAGVVELEGRRGRPSGVDDDEREPVRERGREVDERGEGVLVVEPPEPERGFRRDREMNGVEWDASGVKAVA